MKLRLVLFVALAAAQLAVPWNMILGHEDVLRTGRQYLFKTRPVDPYDVFRGRYVALGFENDVAPVARGSHLEYGQEIYVTVVEGPGGFASFGEARLEKPESGEYLKARAGFSRKNGIALKLPFDRYYLNEELAPEAERAYRRLNRRERKDAHVTVRIKDGQAVLEELYLDGQPVGDYLARQAAEAAQGS